MTDSIFTRAHNQREKNILYQPRSGDEMQFAMRDHHTPIYTYSNLCKIAQQIGATRMLAQMFKYSNDAIILLQDPKDMTSGHWISVSKNPAKKEFYFFSTYGGKPDREKNEWVDRRDLQLSGQFMNIFNDALKECQQHGWEIHYNDYPYQKQNDKTAVCGIYTVAFLRSGANPEKFERDTKSLAAHGINPAIYYFEKYFR